MLPLRDHLPTRTVPLVNYALIAVNVVVYLLERLAIAGGLDPREIVVGYGLVPAAVLVDPAGAAPSVVTSMFVHDPSTVLHLGGNMLFLWIFGDNVEDALGHVRYLVFYLVGGACAAAVQVVADPTATAPMIGASGAISGVLAAYAVLYPRAPVTVLNPIPLLWLFFGLFLTFPAWLVIAEYFVVNLWSAFASHPEGGGGVAFMAHLGGFVAGFALVRIFVLGRPRMDEYARWERWARRRRRET